MCSLLVDAFGFDFLPFESIFYLRYLIFRINTYSFYFVILRLRQANVRIERPQRIGSGKSNTFKDIHNNR